MRVENIAAAADVSPRTFNNYFSSKEEAFVFLWIERTERIAATLRERPRDRSLAVSLTQAFVAQYSRSTRAPVKLTQRGWSSSAWLFQRRPWVGPI
jgi:AcrR family transcriptional regulator